MLQLLSVLIALIAGHAIRKLPVSNATLNRILSQSVVIILFVMGYDFGSHAAHLASELVSLLKETATFTLLFFIFNLTAISFFFARRNRQLRQDKTTEAFKNFIPHILASGQYLLYVIAGIAIGYQVKWNLTYLNSIISVMLFIVLFIIGYQLKQQGITLKNMFANKLGILIALIIIVSSFAAGMVAALALGWSLKTGLVLSSGFGWYTLSGILSAQLINHHIGTLSFFIDFAREIIAILLIPLFGAKYPVPFIGYSAATALDFTLPVIKAYMGEEVIPIAVTSGMILTVLVPIVMPLLALIHSSLN